MALLCGYITLSLAHMPYFPYLWGFACTLECFPSVPAKSSPFLEAIGNLFLEALLGAFFPGAPKQAIWHRGSLGPRFALSVMVQTAVTGRRNPKHDLYTYVQKPLIGSQRAPSEMTHWRLLGCNKKKRTIFFDFILKICSLKLIMRKHMEPRDIAENNLACNL